MVDHPRVTLKRSGHQAALVPDPFQPGAVILEVDGTPQSHVYPDDPSELFFEYVRRIGHVIDAYGETGEALTVLHLGAGALTLARYVEATRPGSRQQVIEIDQDLVDFVREHIPFTGAGSQTPKASIRVRYGDAREILSKLPTGMRGTVDIVVVDIFSGARTPAHVTSQEFYTEVKRMLSPGGIVVLNVADGPGLAFARSQVSTVGSVFGHALAIAEAQVLKGRRFGNVVIVGSDAAVIDDWLPRLLAGGPHPAQALSGAELRAFTASAPIVTDATAIDSPTPHKRLFDIRNR